MPHMITKNAYMCIIRFLNAGVFVMMLGEGVLVQALGFIKDVSNSLAFLITRDACSV